MSYYWSNRKELLKKVRGRYWNRGGKEKSAKYYRKNREVLSQDARNRYRNLSEKEKEAKRRYQSDRYHMNTEKLKKYQR